MGADVTKLTLPYAAKTAMDWIAKAPKGTTVTFKSPKRTISQNARLWAVLSDVSEQADHNGVKYTPEQWKALFMHACKHEVGFMQGLNGEPFPTGFRSSRLTKDQMSELMEFMNAWCAEKGVKLGDEQ